MHLEDKRQLFHAVPGLILALSYHFDLVPWYIFSILFALELVLFVFYSFFPFAPLSHFFAHLEREENLKTFPGIGALAYMLGFALCTALYSKNIAVASMLILSFGDPAATFFGRRGTHFLNGSKKTWEGLIAGTIAAILSAQFIVPLIPAVLTSVIVMSIEACDTKRVFKIDDNLVIPLLSGLLLTFLT